jgi:autotransporter-associated beta strand protein
MNQARHTRLTIRRKFLVLSIATAGLSPIGMQSARAASANWNAAPTNGIWEATGTENNWSTGAGTFPGTTAADSITNTDVATFNAVSTSTAVSVDSTAANALSLNLGAIGFTGATLSNYTIGSTTGNPLVMTSNANQASTTNQIFISGGGRSAGTSAILETINSPIILAPQSSTTAGFYAFQNNSTVLASGDRLVFNGPVSGGTTTSTVTLTLLGANTNANNVVNGAISNGGAAGGLQLVKNNVGTWTLAGNNSYTGTTTVSNGNLRITGNYTGGGNVDLPTGGATGGITVATAGNVTFGNIVLNGGTIANGKSGGAP